MPIYNHWNTLGLLRLIRSPCPSCPFCKDITIANQMVSMYQVMVSAVSFLIACPAMFIPTSLRPQVYSLPWSSPAKQCTCKTAPNTT
jgi:hypothetical protein